jgi:AbiV family abortive infection protein
MSKFLNISPKISKVLHEPIYKNSLKLKKDAILIAENNKSYSTANSLLVLSSEEAIKAILVLLHSEGYNVYKIQDAKKFFSDHKIRHQLAQFLEIINGFIESSMEYEKNEKSKLQISKNETINEVFNLFKDIVNSSKPFIKTGERINSLKEFNDNKNKGLYTDYRESLLIPSFTITEETYIQTKNIVERIFKTYKVLKVMYHPEIDNHFENEKVIKLSVQIKDLVNRLI